MLIKTGQIKISRVLINLYINQVKRMEVSGWTRTFLLALGAFAGVMAAAGIIHVLKQSGVIS